MELLHRNVQRFRGGLVFKAHRLLYHSPLALGVLKKKRRRRACKRRRFQQVISHRTGGVWESRSNLALKTELEGADQKVLWR